MTPPTASDPRVAGLRRTGRGDRAMKSIPVSKAQHTRAWLMKHRLRAKSLDVVAEKALDALAEKEGWDDLKSQPEGEADG